MEKKSKTIIYALNNKVGGGKAVLENLLECLHRTENFSEELEVFCPYIKLNEYQNRFPKIRFFSHWIFQFSMITFIFAIIFPLLFKWRISKCRLH